MHEPGVLENHPERLAEVGPGQISNIDPIEPDDATVDLVEPHQQVYEGRLPGARRPDDRHRLALARHEIEIVDEWLVGEVAERDILESNLGGRRGQPRGLGRIGGLLDLIEQLEDTLGRGDGRLDDVQAASDLDDRERELPGVLDEGEDVAQRHLAGGDPKAADHGDGDVVEVADQVHDRLDDPGDELRPVARVVEGRVLLVEGRDRLLLVAEDRDDVVPCVHLLDVAVQAARRGPLRGEQLL